MSITQHANTNSRTNERTHAPAPGRGESEMPPGEGEGGGAQGKMHPRETDVQARDGDIKAWVSHTSIHLPYVNHLVKNVPNKTIITTE